MSDGFWYFMAILLMIILLGLKITVVLVCLAALYYAFVTRND